jgi:hypothetical protein
VEFKSRVVPGVLIGGVVLAGGGSVIAAAGGSSSARSAAADQYCPDGTPKPPSGDCTGHGNGGNPGGPPEKPGKKPKKHKKPKFRVHRAPKQGCVARTLAFRVSVSNRPKGQKISVYRDGHRIKTTSKRTFKVRFNVSKLRRGAHTLKLRLRGSDGKMYTRTVHFRRC